ncbi:hypothetical protein MBLNU13_g03405t1 [Cladosporium sp. NU13]
MPMGTNPFSVHHGGQLQAPLISLRCRQDSRTMTTLAKTINLPKTTRSQMARGQTGGARVTGPTQTKTSPEKTLTTWSTGAGVGYRATSLGAFIANAPRSAEHHKRGDVVTFVCVDLGFGSEPNGDGGRSTRSNPSLTTLATFEIVLTTPVGLRR